MFGAGDGFQGGIEGLGLAFNVGLGFRVWGWLSGWDRGLGFRASSGRGWSLVFGAGFQVGLGVDGVF